MPKSKKSSKPKKTLKLNFQLKKVDWYGLNHDKVAEKFAGGLTFVNYMNVGEKGDLVAAVYHAATPDTSKGHKEFMLLWKYYDFTTDKEQWMVSGMTREQIEKHAEVNGLACLQCQKVLWSLNRHHWHSCECKNNMFVDGGKDYLHAGAKKIANTAPAKINLLTGEFSIDANPAKR